MQEPRNQELEFAVLGGMLNHSNSLYDALGMVDESYFAGEETKAIFNKLSEYGGYISANVLMKQTKDSRTKSAIQIADNAWTNPDDFAESLKGLKDTYLKRQLYHTIRNAESRFDEEEYETLVSFIDGEINNFNFDDEGDNIIHAYDRAPDALMEYQERRANPDVAKGLPFSFTNQNGVTTGLPSLDKILNGARGGDLIMVAAKTGEGKTAFAINLLRMFSFSHHYKGYYQNTEMDVAEMESRILSPVARVDAQEIYTGQLVGTQREIEEKDNRIVEAFDRYMKSNVVLSRIPSLHIQKSKALAKKVQAKHGLDYLVVDYIGRVDALGFKGDSWEKLAHIAKELKELAMTLNIPIIMLAQRNQAGDVEGAKKMMNECDAVLYFEPVTKEDEPYIQEYVRSDQVGKVNYKIVKRKVRRNDNDAPIFVKFKKSMNFITEVKSS